MGRTKACEFSDSENELACLAKALGHPARIAILQLLIEKKSCICGDIVGELPLSQSTISQHLRELKEAGLIRGTIEGVSVCYCINKDAWQKSRKLMESFFTVNLGSTDCCS